MPEIYCLGASTPYAHTWPDVEARRGRNDRARLKRKKTSTGGMVEGRGGARRRARTEGRRERTKLRSLSILSLYLPLCGGRWRAASPCATEN